VNEFYQRLKSDTQKEPSYKGQYEKRETGARKMKAMSNDDGEPLYSMRDLIKDSIT